MIPEASFLWSRETGLKTNDDNHKGAELRRCIRKTHRQQQSILWGSNREK